MFNYGHVFNYLAESISTGFDDTEDVGENSASEGDDSTTAKPFKKGKVLLRSGFVVKIQSNEEETNFYVRALLEKPS